jgi:phospholipase C
LLFFTDAAAGTLPQFCMIDPGYNSNDDHPVHDVRLGQALISSIFTALAMSPQWNRCLFVLTYDEHGGFYDHVPPPGNATDDNADFQQYGFRVPSIVAGPHVRKGRVSSTVFDHVSVIATLTSRWGLTPLNTRVEATADLSSCIDPAYLNDPQPPAQLPPITLPLKHLLARVGKVTSQPELWELADRGLIPRHLDLRGDSVETVRRVLRRGADLGALRLRD